MFPKKILKVLNLIILMIILIMIFLLGYHLSTEKTYLPKTNELKKTQLIGTYSVDGKKENSPLPADGNLNLDGLHHVTIEGHFDKPIPINTQLMLRLDNVNLEMYINGNLFYKFPDRDESISYSKSSGNLWVSTISSGITPTDKITIQLSNVYTDHVETTFSSFLNNIYYGYESSLITTNIQSVLLNSIIYLFVICIGCIAIGLACIMLRIKRPISKLLYFGGLCVSSGIWCLIDFESQHYLFPYPVFNNNLDIVSLLFSMYFLITYFALYLKSNCKYLLHGLAGTFIFAILITSLLQFLGIADYYESLIFIQAACIIYTPIIVSCIIYEIKILKNKELKKLLIPTIILALGIMGDAICNMFDILPYLIWFKISYLIFIILQFIHITSIIRNALLETAKIQVLKELAYQDALTGVGNRAAYLNTVESIKSNVKIKHPISVFVFDINDLKIVNDTLGHDAGDFLIKRCADILSSVFTTDSVYRIGGDEFVVVYEQQHYISTDYLVTQLEQEIYRSNHEFSTHPPVKIAYGYATFDNNSSSSFDEIFTTSDKNMYKHKNKLKNSH